MKRQALDDPRHYLNRHVEWLEFNRRVLEEARDIGNPLLERVKFLAITANNLDEFVEIRVSSFLQRIEHGSNEISPDGLTTEQELDKISRGDARLRPRSVQMLERRASAGARQADRSKSRPRASLIAKTLKFTKIFLRSPRLPDAHAGHGRSVASVSARAE